MVDFKFSWKLAQWPIGLFAFAVCLFLEVLATSAEDPKPAAGGKAQDVSPAAPKEVPQTARVEAGSPATGSAQDQPTPPVDEKHPLYLPLVEAYKAREVLKGVKDYEALFTKRELIGRRVQTTVMNLKLRHEPFSVYLKFQGANAGREVIFVEGRNKDRQNRDNLFVHEVGIKSIVGTLSLLPDGSDAMADNRYPVTMIGMKNMLDKVIKQWEAEGKLGEIKTQKYPDAKLPSGEECVAYESMHPLPRNQFPFHITRLWIEKKTGMAIRVEQLGFPQKGDKSPPIIEEYTYSKIKTNVPLADVDFSIKNPSYAFP